MLGFVMPCSRNAIRRRGAAVPHPRVPRRRRALLALCFGLVTVLAPAAPAHAAPHADRPEPCTGIHAGDERWGPAVLPRPWQEPVGPLLAGYSRSGNLPPDRFLAEYWDSAAESWKYPPLDGFEVLPDGSADKDAEVLEVGEELDRFGSEYGSFLAPAGDDYAERSLPPQSLTTREADFPCGYHRYEVARPFTAWEGPIAAWFAQPGGGTQILLDPAFLQPGEGQRLNVRWLLSNGYLKPADDLR